MKTIKWHDFFEVETPEYVALKITPDSSVRNWRAEDVTKAFADLFRLPIDRFTKDGAKIQYKIQERAAFDIVFSGGRVQFFVSVPKKIEPIIKRRLQSVWEGATIERGIMPKLGEKARVYALSTRKHDIYSLHTGANDNLPLGSILEAGRFIQENEAGRVSAYFDPMHQATWQNDLKEAWRRLREGHAPRKVDLSFKNALFMTATGLSGLMKEVTTLLSGLISDDKGNIYANEASNPQASEYAIERLENATKTKPNKQGLRTHLWTAAESEDNERADMIARTLAGSYGDLSADNELEARPVKRKRKAEALRTINTKQPPRVNLGVSKLSTAEASKLVQMPGRDLQEKHKNVDAIDQKQVEIDEQLTGDGLKLGDVTYRGKSQTVYMPTGDHDELCLPTAVIGGMGQGKTKGFGANRMVEAANNGFGGLFIDPAKHEVGEEIKKVLNPDQYEIINIADMKPSFDWCECNYSQYGKGLLADAVLSFFEDTDETGPQTERYLRAFVMGMQGTKLQEVFDIMERPKYLQKVIHNMPEGIHKETLRQYGEMSDSMRMRIVQPIYNRLDGIMGDPFLGDCFKSEKQLDFVEIMSQKKIFIIDVAKKDGLTPKQINTIGNLLMTKINLAMQFRPEEKQHPFFVIVDEPHQFTRSSRIWESMSVEARKWRVSFTWLFHYWGQLPRAAQMSIKSALPHYHIYPTAKDTWKDLQEEIAPFTTDDGMNLKRFHAITVLRTGGGNTKPFITHMTLPPSEQRKAAS